MGKLVKTTVDLLDPTLALTVPAGTTGEIVSEATDRVMGSVSKDDGFVSFVPRVVNNEILVKFTGLAVDPYIRPIPIDKMKDVLVNA